MNENPLTDYERLALIAEVYKTAFGAKWDADAILKQVDIHERDQLQRELKE